VQEEGIHFHRQRHHVERQPLAVDQVVVEHPPYLHS
jgi:hypothetical protein